MYDIVFRRSFGSRKDFVLIASGLPTLEAAKAARSVSGDLVVHHGSIVTVPPDPWSWSRPYHQGFTDVVTDESWLWDWEREKKTYAWQSIQHARQMHCWDRNDHRVIMEFHVSDQD